MILVITIYIIFSILVIAFVFNLFFDFINYIRGYGPNLPSTNKTANILAEIYEFKAGQKIADFGSGNGRIINKLKKYPITITGFEINPLLYIFSKLRFLRYKNIKIIKRNFLYEDLSNYNVIFIYGGNFVMSRLQEKIIKEGIKNVAIISNIFKFTSIEYTKKVGKVYLYQL